MKYVVTLNGKNYEVEVSETEATVLNVTDAPAAAPVAVPAPVAAPAPAVAPAPAAAPAPVASTSLEGEKVVAPMPGTVLGVKVNVGDAVKAGDVVIVLEAMKMENDIVAPCDGTIQQILVQKSSTVNTDDVLAVIG